MQEPHGICAGQTLYVSSPSISLLHSHPFSIADVQPWHGMAAARGGTGRLEEDRREVALSVAQPGKLKPAQQQLGGRDSLDASGGEDDFDEVFDSSMLGDRSAGDGKGSGLSACSALRTPLQGQGSVCVRWPPCLPFSEHEQTNS